MRAQSIRAAQAGPRLLRSMQELWDRVWPPATAGEQRSADALLKERRPDTTASYAMFHYVEGDEGEVLAACKTFARRIRSQASGREISVLALAGVCSEPDFRGQGLGKAVVTSAFARLREEPDRFQLCLFQTGVPEFYGKLGARVIDNAFVNSLDPGGGLASPWWERWVMIYPADAEWLEGAVDLIGPAY